ncbi:hypothetical protein AAC387_Pa10g1596 [Persea americana]
MWLSLAARSGAFTRNARDDLWTVRSYGWRYLQNSWYRTEIPSISLKTWLFVPCLLGARVLSHESPLRGSATTGSERIA